MKSVIKLVTGGLVLFVATGVQADQVILDDLIVDGSICVGFDCVNGESFGFDTIRIKENNLRIRAQDTSSTSSFPTRDWQITFNDSANGGANKFSVDDIDGGRTPFTLEGNAPSHSLYVDDGGRVGFGTSTPVTDLHVKSGNTPTLRLEQDGSSGFAPQTWDVAGNEANFFIRDATNGSTLPFRIRPGAPTGAIDIHANGNIGFGSSSPLHKFHLENTSGDDVDDFVVSEDGRLGLGTTSPNVNSMLHIAGGGLPRIALDNSTHGTLWTIDVNNSGVFRFNHEVGAGQELLLTSTGDLTVTGDINSGGTTVVPDYVFSPDYELMSLDELSSYLEENSHLPNIPSAAEVKENGVNLTQFQMQLLEKVEELTLYTLQQEKTIRALESKVEQMELVSPN